MKSIFKSVILSSGIILLSDFSFLQAKTDYSLTESVKSVKMDTSKIKIDNKEAVRDLYENILNKREFRQLDKLISAEYVNAKGGKGVEGFKKQILELIEAFPDAQWRVEDIIAEGNKVVVKQHFQGTQTGQFKDIAPTSRAIATEGIGIYEFENGKIIRSQVQTDQLGFLQQLGVLPVDISAFSQKKENEKTVCFIDKFFVPENSIKEFTERMNYNRNFIKDLPGFIKDEVYEQKDEKGNLTVITVAVWQSQDNVNYAKSAVQAEYKRIGFNPLEFYQHLNIKMERGLYKFYHEQHGSR